MRTMRIWVLIAAVVALALPSFAGNDTIINLQKAYNAEMNSRALYLAYAGKADQEDYAAVASLFRAAAFAEESQAAEHEKLIRGFGVVPKYVPLPATTGTTDENLRAAANMERDEQDALYEPFIQSARDEKRMEALRSFTRAQKAEAEHQALFERAAGMLEHLKGSTAVEYYVCPVCGEIRTDVDVKHCPDCGHKTADYIIVR